MQMWDDRQRKECHLEEGFFQCATKFLDGLAQMPELGGIETVRRIRKIVGEDASIIILTAYDWVDIESEAREAGVTGFISKPLFPSDLKRVLLQSCGKACPGQAEEEEDAAAGFVVLVVVVEAGKASGDCLVTVTSEGLVGATVRVPVKAASTCR